MEAAGGANLEGGVEGGGVVLEGVPAGLGGVQGREERGGAAEIVGLDEAEGLVDELAAGAGGEGGR